IATVVHDLLADETGTNRFGKTLVLTGDAQPAPVHALVHVINQALGNAGRTVIYTAPLELRPVDEIAQITELVRDCEQGRVDTLLILGGNPAFDAPVDLEFARHLQKVPLRFHLGLYQDETAVLCDWHMPEVHY